jgi:hypothetical protein
MKPITRPWSIISAKVKTFPLPNPFDACFSSLDFETIKDREFIGEIMEHFCSPSINIVFKRGSCTHGKFGEGGI